MEKFEIMFEEIEKMPHSEEKMVKLMNFSTKAEEEEQYYFMFLADLEVIDTCMNIHEYKVLINTFFPVFEFYKSNEEHLQEYTVTILWMFKWVLEHLPKFPQYTKRSIENVFTEFQTYCEKYSYSLKSYYKLRYLYAKNSGLVEEADKFYEIWTLAERDDLSDCVACDMDEEVKYHLDKGNLEFAVEYAQPLFERKISCGEVPDKTFFSFVLPCYKKGKLEKAKSYQERGLFLIKDKPFMLEEAAQYLLYNALTEPKKGLQIYEKHVKEAEKRKNPYAEFHFYLATYILILHYEKKNIAHSLSKVSVRTTVYYLANYFDVRNKNLHYNNTIEETIKLLNKKD